MKTTYQLLSAMAVIVLAWFLVGYGEAKGQSEAKSAKFYCSPAPCVLPPTLASEGSGFVTDSHIVTNPINQRNCCWGVLMAIAPNPWAFIFAATAVPSGSASSACPRSSVSSACISPATNLRRAMIEMGQPLSLERTLVTLVELMAFSPCKNRLMAVTGASQLSPCEYRARPSRFRHRWQWM